SLAAALGEAGRRALALQADVSRPEAARALVREVEAELGRIDALVNCAGPYHRVPLMEESLEGWHAMFDNNLHPVFYLSREVAPAMMERKWGRIVNFSVANAEQQVGQPGITAHYIAKVGVLVLTRSLAKALAPHGITVNAISPGFIDSGSAPLEEMSKMVRNIPAGYVGSTQDVAEAVAFLLSDEARYVNGSNIHLSGAWGI
ncbi:MAG: 3-oxoacyl-ACP reductase, partial [Acidobacteria bacterium]